MKIPMALWPRLMPLLDQALDQAPSQREAWLAAQDLDGETATALRQLLADREELDRGDFMAELPQLDAAPASEPHDATGQHSSQSGLFTGDMLGPYRLIRPLGQGGMSVVWLAERDDGQMRRHVALKMPHAGPGQALLAERLRRERDILASLEHRHIARLYDVGTTPLGLPFLVLEYIEGEALPTYCDEHQLGIRDRLKLFLQVLSAVQYAHTKLVLHRDLKPSNILVNEQGEVKLLDFGIAKLIRDSETGAAPSTELTQHSGHVLTPDYAAPEQIAGQPLTTASDVYALGVILFELLTGQRPYRLPRGTRGALEEAILATDPRRPSQVWLDADVQTHHPTAVTLSDLAGHFRATPRRLHQLLKGDLDVIVHTALQKQATRRYATAEAFAQDIRHHLAREPIAAQPDSRWYRAGKYVQRHALALSAVGAVVLALCAGLGVALWQAREARQEAAKANAIKDFLIGLFENGDVEQADSLRKRQQTVEQLLVTSAEALGTQLKDHPEVRVELQGVVGGLLHNLAITDTAIKLREQRVAQLEAMGASVAQRAQAWRDLADSQDARGDTTGARQSLEKGLALCATSGMEPVEVCYGLQVAKGRQLVMAGKFDEVERMIGSALVALRHKAPSSTQMAEALTVKGDVLGAHGDFQSSYALYQESMQLRAKAWGLRSTRLAKERYQLALGLAGQRRFRQSIEQLSVAWQAMVEALGRDHQNSLVIEMFLGLLQVLVDNRLEGHIHVTHAATLVIHKSALLDPRFELSAEMALGQSLMNDGQLLSAGRHLKRAYELAVKVRGSMSDIGAEDAAYAWYLQDVGEYEQARNVLLSAKHRIASNQQEAFALIADLSERVASTYLLEGRLDEALAIYKAEIAQAGGNGHSDFIRRSAYEGQAAVLIAKGDFRAAKPIVERQYQELLNSSNGEQYRSTHYTATDLLARVYAGNGQCEQAVEFFKKAIDLMKIGNPDNPYLAATRARYASCLLKLGHRSQAKEAMELAGRVYAHQHFLAPHIRQPYDALLRQWQAASPSQEGV